MWRNPDVFPWQTTYFYSHIPCGMWHSPWCILSPIMAFLLTHPLWDVTQNEEAVRGWAVFLLTHPLWDVTCCILGNIISFTISTHTSLVGCDHISYHIINDRFNFYSHIPCGMWLICLCSIFHFYNFYSHIPCGMWLVATNAPVDLIYFYSHIPCGMWQICITYF